MLVLITAGCGSRNEASAGGEGAPIDEAALDDERLLAEAAARQNAGTEGLVMAAMAGLVDPSKARYRNVRPGIGGGACGEVSTSKGKEAAPFRPFVVTPQGVAVISAGTGVTFRDPADPFPDLYIRWCATPEELQTLAPELKRGPVDGVLAESNEAISAEAGKPEPALPAADPVAPAGPAALPSTEADHIDRFEEVVRRKNP